MSRKRMRMESSEDNISSENEITIHPEKVFLAHVRLRKIQKPLSETGFEDDDGNLDIDDLTRAFEDKLREIEFQSEGPQRPKKEETEIEYLKHLFETKVTEIEKNVGGVLAQKNEQIAHLTKDKEDFKGIAVKCQLSNVSLVSQIRDLENKLNAVKDGVNTDLQGETEAVSKKAYIKLRKKYKDLKESLKAKTEVSVFKDKLMSKLDQNTTMERELTKKKNEISILIENVDALASELKETDSLYKKEKEDREGLKAQVDSLKDEICELKEQAEEERLLDMIKRNTENNIAEENTRRDKDTIENLKEVKALLKTEVTNLKAEVTELKLLNVKYDQSLAENVKREHGDQDQLENINSLVCQENEELRIRIKQLLQSSEVLDKSNKELLASNELNVSKHMKAEQYLRKILSNEIINSTELEQKIKDLERLLSEKERAHSFDQKFKSGKAQTCLTLSVWRSQDIITNTLNVLAFIQNRKKIDNSFSVLDILKNITEHMEGDSRYGADIKEVTDEDIEDMLADTESVAETVCEEENHVIKDKDIVDKPIKVDFLLPVPSVTFLDEIADDKIQPVNKIIEELAVDDDVFAVLTKSLASKENSIESSAREKTNINNHEILQKCAICNVHFRNIQFLEKHTAKKHSSQDLGNYGPSHTQSTSSNKFIYICDEKSCTYRSETKSDLKNHKNEIHQAITYMSVNDLLLLNVTLKTSISQFVSKWMTDNIRGFDPVSNKTNIEKRTQNFFTAIKESYILFNGSLAGIELTSDYKLHIIGGLEKEFGSKKGTAHSYILDLE